MSEPPPDPGGHPDPPRPWHQLALRHVWKMRAYVDDLPGTEGWFWEAYTTGSRRIGVRSNPDNRRWESEEKALAAAREWLETWERDRPEL
jgi:hypothetical protein